MNPQDTELQKQLAERFHQLPKVVQDAITSADVEQHLRTLADTHKLHLDQWQVFENEVMLAVLGFQQVEDLERNIVQHVGIAGDIAHALAQGANSVIFEPIRQQLERNLEHPDAQAAIVSGAEAARTQILDAEHVESTASPPPIPVVQPATPPPPAPDIKIARPSDSTAYKPGEPSAARKVVTDDPYREPPA